MELNQINIDELETILKYIIENNKRLRELNKKTTAVEVIGEAGIGKTSVLIQLAEELELDVVKLNLAQLEELGDLIGFPLKEYYICKDDDCRWISNDLLKYYLELGYNATGETRMSYATPQWLPTEMNPNGGLLILDDFSRADPRFINATMELIDRGQYISWSIPENWTICLTSNPDNGDYNVVSMDNAQKTRYVSFDLAFDKDVWARWAEKERIDSRCINFVLSYPEILKKEGNVQTVNPRSLVTFFNTISGFKDFNNKESLVNILNISKGCFTSKENVVGNLFTLFINNKLDKLISPDDMLFKDWETVKKQIHSVVYNDKDYRADIGATLSIRFLNYVMVYFSEKGSKSDLVIKRILDFIDSDEILLSEDMIFNLCKQLNSKYPTRVNKLMSNPKVIRKVVL